MSKKGRDKHPEIWFLGETGDKLKNERKDADKGQFLKYALY